MSNLSHIKLKRIAAQLNETIIILILILNNLSVTIGMTSPIKSLIHLLNKDIITEEIAAAITFLLQTLSKQTSKITWACCLLKVNMGAPFLRVLPY